MTIYTGDILIKELESGNFDIEFVNGQPIMTNGFETMSIMAVFGEDWWGNDLVTDEDEKMLLTFPDVIRRGVVSDKTKNDGTKAIEKALKFLITKKIAQKVIVTGEIISAFGIGWLIEIEPPNNETVKFFINWKKSELTAGFNE